MKQLIIGQNKVYLDAPELTGTETVTFDLVNETLTVLLNDISAIYDSSEKQYYVILEIEDGLKTSYPRGIWKAVKNGFRVPLKNYIQQFELLSETEAKIEVVPLEFFTNFALQKHVDRKLQIVIERADSEGLRSVISAATGDLGRAVKTTFYPKTYKQEKRDLYDERYTDSFWVKETYHKPLIKLLKYQLWYGQQQVMDIPIENFVVDNNLGTIEFLPGSLKGIDFYTQYVNAVIAVSHFGGSMTRIPGFHHIEYEAGIDFLSLDSIEQDSIRHAICREAMLKHLGRLDPNVYAGSVSKSVEGHSKSVTYAGMPWLNQQASVHEQWKTEFMRDIGTNFDIIIV